MEQPLAGELAAAQGQQAPGLLPSGPQGVQIVVKHHHEPLLHIVRDLVQLPQQVKRRAAAQQGVCVKGSAKIQTDGQVRYVSEGVTLNGSMAETPEGETSYIIFK